MPANKQVRRAKSLHARIKRKVIKKVKRLRLENLYQKFRHLKRKNKKHP